MSYPSMQQSSTAAMQAHLSKGFLAQHPQMLRSRWCRLPCRKQWSLRWRLGWPSSGFCSHWVISGCPANMGCCLLWPPQHCCSGSCAFKPIQMAACLPQSRFLCSLQAQSKQREAVTMGLSELRSRIPTGWYDSCWRGAYTDFYEDEGVRVSECHVSLSHTQPVQCSASSSSSSSSSSQLAK